MLGKLKISFNFYGLIFGVFYLLLLGLWKRAVLIFALGLLTDYIVAIVHNDAGTGQWAGTAISSVLCAGTANYGYYVKKRTGVESWNIADSFVEY